MEDAANRRDSRASEAEYHDCDRCGQSLPVMVDPALLPKLLGMPWHIEWAVRTTEGKEVWCDDKIEALVLLDRENAKWIAWAEETL